MGIELMPLPTPASRTLGEMPHSSWQTSARNRPTPGHPTETPQVGSLPLYQIGWHMTFAQVRALPPERCKTAGALAPGLRIMRVFCAPRPMNSYP